MTSPVILRSWLFFYSHAEGFTLRISRLLIRFRTPRNPAVFSERCLFDQPTISICGFRLFVSVTRRAK